LYKFNSIYFPDENYYNTNEFPKEWMEIFDNKDKIIERETIAATDLAIYAPNCSKKDLAKMLHAESEKRMRSVKAESILYQYINSKNMTYHETVRSINERKNK